MSLALAAFNIAGWNVDNVKNKTTLSMADHFNNPVPDGTAVTVKWASGGRVGSWHQWRMSHSQQYLHGKFLYPITAAENGRVQLTAHVGRRKLY